MKKISTLLIVVFGFTTLFAQAPQRLSYQAVVRDASDKLIANKNVSMRISILQGNANGSLIYSEAQTVASNINGLVTLQIGGGNVLSGAFSSINWSSGNYFVKTETDPNGGSNYSIAGTSQLLSVPYALYANASGSGGGTTYNAGNGININGNTISATDNSATNEIQNLSISGNTVSLSNGGGSVVLPPSSGFTLPYSGTVNVSGNGTEEVFKVVNTNTAGSPAIWGQQGTGAGSVQNRTGVFGSSSNGYGVVGSTSANSAYAGVAGSGTDYAAGVSGISVNGVGGEFESQSNAGIAGYSISGVGGYFQSNSGPALVAYKGNVGIGTATPYEKLTIDQGRILFSGTATATTGGANTIEKTSLGFFEFGGTVASNLDNRDYLGTSSKRWVGVHAINGIINTSDRREKQNIAVLNYGLKEVMQLKPVTFEWIKRSEQGRKIGFIAQDLQQVVKEVVSDTEWSRGENNTMVSKPAERLGVYYSDLIPVLTKAIQEQQAIIEAQNKRIEGLEKAVELLKK